ncbi:MAG: hypothetical protein QMD96_00935 [Anaerosomatales bacterium]|nr:hypothetical protein [Anaerosomatales bacterium]
MGFLVIGIDRNTGAAVLLTETPLPTRKSAIDALETLAASDQSDLASYDIVLVDLDAGIPIIVVQPPQSPVAALEAEAADERPLLHAMEPEAAAGPESAAGVEPEAVPPLAGLDELAADAAYPADEAAFAADAFAALEEPSAPAEIEAVSEAGEEAPSPAASDEQGLLDALRRAADSLIQQGIEVPEPGGQEAPAPVEAADALAVEEAIPVAEPMGVVETPPAEPAPSEADLASVVEPVRPVIMGEYPETVQPAEPQPYQPAGDLEIAAYTCDDCVYSNTCPKAGESSPADCGTFQWRSF